MVKETIIFLAGAGIGAGISFIVTKKKYEKLIIEEVDTLRKKYKVEEGSATDKINNIKNYISEHYNISEKSVDNSDDIVFVREEEEDLEEEMAESEFPEEEPEMSKIPYPITPEEYFEGKDSGIAKRALVYYAGDDTLLDEMSEEVQELSQIGVENLRYFGKYEDMRLYIRNEAICEDYEVIFEEGKWHPDEEV